MSALSLIAGLSLPVLTARSHRPYRFDSWTTDNGLPQGSINSILQTRDGYIWLATFGGLARFDGLRFQVFNAATDVPQSFTIGNSANSAFITLSNRTTM